MKFSAYTKVQKRLMLAIAIVSILILVVIAGAVLWIQSALKTINTDIDIPIRDTVSESISLELTTQQKLDILQTLSATDISVSSSTVTSQKEILTTLKNTSSDSSETPSQEDASDLQVN